MFAVQADSFTPSAALLAGPTAAASTSRDTILVVEDENNIAGLITCILERAHFRVVRAASATEGLAMFETYEAETALVMLDATLPDMHGGELCRRLRAKAPEMPVLFVSGRDLRAMLPAFATAAPIDFLPKPFLPSEVVKKVRQLVSANR